MLTAAALGFLLGLRHALDPDHIVALSTLVTRHRSPWSASWVGASWGVGHALTILAVGAVVIELRVTVPEQISLAAEFGVGILLVTLGITNLRAARRAWTPADADERPLGRTLARSSAVGLAHGLAGSGALALLATAAMPTPAAALAYLVVFGVGTLTGMIALSQALGAPVALFGDSAEWHSRLAAGTGLASLAFGVWLMHRVGFVEGLLA